MDALRDVDDPEYATTLIDAGGGQRRPAARHGRGPGEFATQRVGQASLLLADIDLAQVARSAVQDLAPASGPSACRSPDAVALAEANGVAHAPGGDQPGGQRPEVLAAGQPGRRRPSPGRRRLRARHRRSPTTDAASTPTTSTPSSTSSPAGGWPRTTAAPGSAWPACASWWRSSTATSSSTASWVSAPRSRSSCPRATLRPRAPAQRAAEPPGPVAVDGRRGRPRGSGVVAAAPTATRSG